MKEAFDLMKRKIMQDRRIGRSSLEAFLEILREVEAEYINKSTEHINKSGDCSTNADRIRAMDDEELMEFLEPTFTCGNRCPAENGSCYDGCRARIREWLKSPIE